MTHGLHCSAFTDKVTHRNFVIALDLEDFDSDRGASPSGLVDYPVPALCDLFAKFELGEWDLKGLVEVASLHLCVA